MSEEYVVSEKGSPARGIGTQNNVKMLAIPHIFGILGGLRLQTKYISPLFPSSDLRVTPTIQISVAPHYQFKMAV